MERSDAPTLEKNQKILFGISAEHMGSDEVECMTKSIPIQVTYVDSYTTWNVQSGFGHEQEMIALGPANTS